MSYPTHPGGNELDAYLKAAKLVIAPELMVQFPDFMQAARSDFERQAGRCILAVAATRSFDPPGNPRGVLDLEADLATSEGVGVTVCGKSLTLGKDVRLLDERGGLSRPPFTQAQFSAPLCSYGSSSSSWGCIEITGQWGYALTVPADVWQAELARGAWLAYPLLAHGFRRGLVRWTDGDVTEEYQNNPLEYLKSFWGGEDPLGRGGQFGNTASLYARWA